MSSNPPVRVPQVSRVTARAATIPFAIGTLLVGTAVFAGVFGAVGLLLRQRWAVALFGVSLAALVLQVVATYLLTPAWSAMGPTGLAMPALLLVIASLLLGHARTAARRGWIR